jgi:FkbM family methyltransferase
VRHPLLALLKRFTRLPGSRAFGRVRAVRATYDFFYNALTPSSVMVQGHLMWLDHIDALELSTSEVYEPASTKLLLSDLRPGHVVLDIGANIGYYTLLAARIVGPQGKVFAFEPEPTNFALLRKNVEANGYRNVVLVNKAVAHRTSAATLYLNERNPGDHRLFDVNDGRESISIDMVSLDDYFGAALPAVQFIKMDIQGAEHSAIRGMENLLRANGRVRLLTEFWPAGIRRSGSDPIEFLEKLRRLGFELNEFGEDGAPSRVVDARELVRRHERDEKAYTNLYCVKQP